MFVQKLTARIGKVLCVWIIPNCYILVTIDNWTQAHIDFFLKMNDTTVYMAQISSVYHETPYVLHVFM